MRKNSLYLSGAEIYTAVIEDADGAILYSKKFDGCEDALFWCRGILKDNGSGAFKILDTDTKKCLESGRLQGNDFIAYSNKPEAKKEVGVDQLSIGTQVEMEHAEMIKSVLGDTATIEMITKVAERIAKDHLKEDPEYYKKLERIEK